MLLCFRRARTSSPITASSCSSVLESIAKRPEQPKACTRLEDDEDSDEIPSHSRFSMSPATGQVPASAAA